MSMSKNIARLAVTAGLTAALSFGGVMAPVTMAFAEDAATTTNTIRINKNAQNGDVKYKAYQIFKADVLNEGDKKVVSNVVWAVPDTVQTEIINAIEQSEGYAKTSKKLPTTGATAQNVADWLAANIQNAGAVDNDALLNKIAGFVKVTNPVKPKNPINNVAFNANISVSFDESGYYLFLTDSDIAHQLIQARRQIPAPRQFSLLSVATPLPLQRRPVFLLSIRPSSTMVVAGRLTATTFSLLPTRVQTPLLAITLSIGSSVPLRIISIHSIHMNIPSLINCLRP